MLVCAIFIHIYIIAFDNSCTHIISTLRVHCDHDLEPHSSSVCGLIRPRCHLSARRQCVLWLQSVETVPAAHSCLQVFTSFFFPQCGVAGRNWEATHRSSSPSVTCATACLLTQRRAAAFQSGHVATRLKSARPCEGTAKEDSLSLSRTHARTQGEAQKEKVGDPAVWLTSLPGGTRGVDLLILGACARVPFCAVVLRTCARAGC